MLNDIITAFSYILVPYNLFAIFIGTFGGIIIGALPGLSSVMGLSILLPFTFALDGMGGILMLLGIFCGSIYGGSISAILINTPGTAASAATALDGHPMATVKRQPGRALGISTFSSLFGGLFSCICLIIFSPILAKISLQFSAPEYFALAIFGISIITSVSSSSVAKGLLGGLMGLLLGTVGIDKMTGVHRFTFHSLYLTGGISFIPLLIGMFAFSQGLITMENAYGRKKQRTDIKVEKVFPSIVDIKRIFPTVLRSSIIGTFIGAIPGTGGDIASWVSYNEAKRWSKHKEDFGKGAPEGIAASESGNNSISGGALVPLLTLGIPGDAGTAVMLGSLMILGIAPGPLLFTEQRSVVYLIFIGLFIANIFMGILGFWGIRWFSKVINVPNTILVPLVFTFCLVGTFALNNSLQDVYFMIIAGVVGYFLIKMDFSIPPIILGLVLGPMTESNLRRSLVLFNGDPKVFLFRPICSVFLILAVVSLIYPYLLPIIRKMRKKHI